VNDWHAIGTPFGVYHAEIGPRGLRALHFPGTAETIDTDLLSEASCVHARTLRDQLVRYHNGSLTRFDIALDPNGATVFRRRVWSAMQAIPYGATVTYGELAKAIGCRSARAIGQACGANPIPVIIPCHRVIAANGRLGGWSGKPGMKERLLRLESSRLGDSFHSACKS